MKEFIFIAAALAIILPFAVAWQIRRATARLELADRAWGSLEKHAHVLMEDRHLNPVIGDFVERVINKVGDGSLTRGFLFFIVFRPQSKQPTNHEWREAVSGLEAGQEKQFLHFMVDAIFYDSLRTVVSGSLLRRIVLYWLEATASDDDAPVSREQVKPITFAANQTFKPA